MQPRHDLYASRFPVAAHSSMQKVSSQGDVVSHTPALFMASSMLCTADPLGPQQLRAALQSVVEHPASVPLPPEPPVGAPPPLGPPPLVTPPPLGAPPLLTPPPPGAPPPLVAPPLGFPPLDEPPLAPSAPDPELPPLEFPSGLVVVELHATKARVRQTPAELRRRSATTPKPSGRSAGRPASRSTRAPGGVARQHRPTYPPFVFNFDSFSWMNARISSAMSSSLAHCSLYRVTGKRPRP